MFAFPFQRRLTRFSLLWVITVPFLVQTIVTIAFIGYYSLRTSQKAIDGLAHRLIDNIGYSIQEEIERRLSLPNWVNEINRIAILQQELNWTDPEQMAKHFLSQSYGFKELDFIYFANTQGGAVLAGQRTPGEWIVRKNQPFEAGDYYTYRVDDRSDRLELLNIANYDARTRPWYQAAEQAKQATWSPVYFFSSRPTLGISASIPVYDAEGKLLGILASDLALESLNQFLHNLQSIQENSTTVYLMERSGDLIANSRDAPVYQTLPNQEVERMKATESLNPIIRASSQKLLPNAEAIVAGHQRLMLNATPYYTQVHFLQDDHGLDWVMVLAVPEAVFTRQVKTNVQITIILFSLAGLASVGFGWLLYRGLLSPITQLCKEADALTQGNWDFPMTSEGAREFQQLSEAFQMMRQQATDLKAVNRDLDRATRLKDEFLANMSHELRTPLNAILGMAEGLEDEVFGPINDRQSNALKTIGRSGSHLLELINDILDLAKIESGQMELDLQPTAIAPLCELSLVFIKQLAHKKQLNVRSKIPPNLPYLLADDRRIRQVLINLLNNAVKFTPEGGEVTLEVTYPSPLGETKPHCKLIRISVTDTGIGIAPENIQKLFKPFIQIDSSLNRKYDGTGLGLALVKNIVELHGGKIDLASEEGVGSCFSIDLPCVTLTRGSVPNPAPTPALETETKTVAPPPQPLEPHRILLVEDNEANIVSISNYLRAKGYTLYLAKNGREGVEMAQAQKPDLILMDIQIPEMDGYEATRTIRQIPALAEVPIIALTALAMESDREKCLAAGANDYMSKPIRLKQLVSLIQQTLANESNT